MWITIKYVLWLFIIETILQILYLSVSIKFFESYHTYESFFDIFLKQIYFFGSVKLVFCLPLYYFFYFSVVDRSWVIFKTALYHTVVFSSVCLFSMFSSFAMCSGLYDLIFLSSISFVSSFVMSYYRVKPWK